MWWLRLSKIVLDCSSLCLFIKSISIENIRQHEITLDDLGLSWVFVVFLIDPDFFKRQMSPIRLIITWRQMSGANVPDSAVRSVWPSIRQPKLLLVFSDLQCSRLRSGPMLAISWPPWCRRSINFKKPLKVAVVVVVTDLFKQRLFHRGTQVWL